MRRFVVSTMVGAGLFLTRMILLVIGMLLRRLSGVGDPQPSAPRGPNGHHRPAAAA